MVCYKQTQQNCPTAPPCANGEKCAEPADTTCTTETVSACVPRYLTPCQADADCGVGFTCEEEQECSCSGSVGSAGSGSASAGSASGSGGGDASSDGGAPTPAAPAPADGGSADPVPPEGSAPSADGGTPTPPDCTCAPSGTKACNLKIVACSVDQGCPSGWTCGDNPHRVCSSSSDGTTSCSGDPAKVCLPPYADLSLGGSGHDIGLDAPGRGETSGSAGTGGGNTTTSPPSSNPESPGTAQDGSKAATSPSSSTTESDSGCAVGEPRGAASGTFGFLALAFAGLVGLRRRRTN
jgi:MYXO-CTERM domain-containing protein